MSWFNIRGPILLAVSALLVAGCGEKHTKERERDPYFASPFSRAQIDFFFAQAPEVQSVDNAPRVSPPKPPTPKTQPISYPINKVVDGKSYSISVHPTGVASTSHLMIERIVPAKVTLKKDFVCILNLTNISKNTLYDVTVSEPLSFIFRSADPAPIYNRDDTLIWDLGHMASEETRTIQLRGYAGTPKRISNCVTVVYSSRQKACAEIDVTNPSLKLTQSGPQSVIQCDLVPITFEIANNGTGLARNVIIRQELPEGLASLDNQKTIIIRAGNIEQGESKAFKVNLKVLKTGLFRTRAQAISEDNVTAYADYSVKALTPRLAMTTSGPAKRYAGRIAQYEITVTNQGDGPANNLVVTEAIPPGTTYISASDGGIPTNGVVAWNLGTLAPLASKKVSVRIKLDKVGIMVNKARANAYCATASAECKTVVEGIAAILLEVVDLDDPVEVGSNSTYEINVTNQGSSAGTNIRIVANLPDEFDYVASDGPTTATLSGNAVSFAPLASLPAKQTVLYHIEVKGTKTGDLRFHVELQSDQMSSPVMETESTHVY